MFISNAVLCLSFLTIGLSRAGPLDNLSKCSINDGDCLKDLFEKTLHHFADSGLPEYNVPALKPFYIKNASVSVLGLTEASIDKGTITGMPDCTILKMKTDIDNRVITAESLCDQITLDGHYIVKAGPLLSTITGDSLSGDGHGFIQINNMILKMKIPFDVEKKEDGKIYIVPDAERSTYSTDVKKDIKFKLDNVIVGGVNVSEAMTNFMNNNWQFINKSFGKIFSDKIMVLWYDFLKKFFSKLPAENFISDDLSRYVGNNEA